MDGRRNGDRIYTVVLLAFLVGLVALGLLGVPALLVAALGAVVAAVGIAALHGRQRRVPADVRAERARGQLDEATPDRPSRRGAICRRL